MKNSVFPKECGEVFSSEDAFTVSADHTGPACEVKPWAQLVDNRLRCGWLVEFKCANPTRKVISNY